MKGHIAGARAMLTAAPDGALAGVGQPQGEFGLVQVAHAACFVNARVLMPNISRCALKEDSKPSSVRTRSHAPTRRRVAISKIICAGSHMMHVMVSAFAIA